MSSTTNQPSIDLNGQWAFAYTLEPPTGEFHTVSELQQAGLTVYPCQVPGNFELDLQAAGLIGDPFYGMNMASLRKYEAAHIWYFRRFAGEQHVGMIPELVFEGLDCYADIYLNGQQIGSCDNMLVEQVLPVAGLLRKENELLIHIRPAMDEARKYEYPPLLQSLGSNYDALYVRKAPHMYGWDIMPRALSAGLWRPAAVRFRPAEPLEQFYVETLDISADHARATLAAHFDARLTGTPADLYEIQLTGVCGDSTFAHRQRMLFQGGVFRLTVENPALWWPRGRGEAALYACQVSLWKNGEQIDSREFRCGIRTVALDRTSVTDPQGSGEFCFRVNGEKVFILGTNWVPVDAYHSRDAARIPPIMEMVDDLGINMIRCWGGNVYEDELFYNLCDEQGVLVWQDFAMACSIYPQDADFRSRLADEVRQVVRRLRQHPCIALWSGDNECDASYLWSGRNLDPNSNVLTRQVLPGVLLEEDAGRPYLPSSPYIDSVAFYANRDYLPENHLWGPRDYYKSQYYQGSLCHFASEIGYHGCPSVRSIHKFISPDKLWPYQGNEEWLLHASSPVPGVNLYDYRVELMAKQVRELFGEVPGTLEEFAFASQVSQAEAFKFFIELFRGSKWRRTGLIWWNLIDGWPQFSDAIVDYYMEKKLAYSFIQRSHAPLCLMLKEPGNWKQVLVACNDTREDLPLDYALRDVESGEVLAEGQGIAKADSVTPVGEVPFSMGTRRFYLITWSSRLGQGVNHYLAGNPPFSLAAYRTWLERAGLLAVDAGE